MDTLFTPGLALPTIGFHSLRLATIANGSTDEAPARHRLDSTRATAERHSLSQPLSPNKRKCNFLSPIRANQIAIGLRLDSIAVMNALVQWLSLIAEPRQWTTSTANASN